MGGPNQKCEETPVSRQEKLTRWREERQRKQKSTKNQSSFVLTKSLNRSRISLGGNSLSSLPAQQTTEVQERIPNRVIRGAKSIDGARSRLLRQTKNNFRSPLVSVANVRCPAHPGSSRETKLCLNKQLSLLEMSNCKQAPLDATKSTSTSPFCSWVALDTPQSTSPLSWNEDYVELAEPPIDSTPIPQTSKVCRQSMLDYQAAPQSKLSRNRASGEQLRDDLPLLESALQEFQQGLDSFDWRNETTEESAQGMDPICRSYSGEDPQFLLPIPSSREANSTKQHNKASTSADIAQRHLSQDSKLRTNTSVEKPSIRQRSQAPFAFPSLGHPSLLRQISNPEDNGLPIPAPLTTPRNSSFLTLDLETPEEDWPRRQDAKQLLLPIPSLREHLPPFKDKAPKSDFPSREEFIDYTKGENSGTVKNKTAFSSQKKSSWERSPSNIQPIKASLPKTANSNLAEPRLQEMQVWDLKDEDDSFDWRHDVVSPDFHPSQPSRRRASSVLLPIPSLRNDLDGTPDQDLQANRKEEATNTVDNSTDAEIEHKCSGQLKAPDKLADEKPKKVWSPKNCSCKTNVHSETSVKFKDFEQHLPLETVPEEAMDQIPTLKEQLVLSLNEIKRLQDQVKVATAFENRVTPFRDVFEDLRKMRADNTKLRRDKEQIEQMVEGLQQQMMTAVQMAVQKTKGLQIQLEASQSELHAARELIRQLKSE
jgi:hypothetical protein